MHHELDPKIDDDWVKAYLIRPDKSDKQQVDGYRTRWEQIKEVVGYLIPHLKEQNRWTEAVYKKLRQTDRRLFDTPAGKVLFKYDPAHTTTNQGSKHKATLWVEGRLEPYHDDEW